MLADPNLVERNKLVLGKVNPHYARQVMFPTAFPVTFAGRKYSQYCTYSKRLTLKYLRCILFGHDGITYSDVSVGSDSVKSVVPARCCNRSYYQTKDDIAEETE